jgi:hypothetical protein
LEWPAIAYVALNDFHAGRVRKVGALFSVEVIKDAHRITTSDKRVREMGADEPGATGNETVFHDLLPAE